MTGPVLAARPDRRPRAVPVTLALLGALVMIVAAPPARAHDAHDVADADDPRAVDLIARSAAAPRTVSYTGTQYVSAWSSLDPTASAASAVMTLEHQAGQGTRVGVPNQQAALLEWRDNAAWLYDGGGSAELLLSAYQVAVAGTGTVAGRPAVVVEARRDDGSLAARLWLDEATALALRRETFDAGGALLGASAFVDIDVDEWTGGSGAGAGSLPSVEPHTTGTVTPGAGPDAAALNRSDIDALRDHGWHCPGELAGGMALYGARRTGDVVHLSYSDGVMAVSLFEQPGTLDPDGLTGYREVETANGTVYAAAGPPARYTWSSSGQVLTVVSQAPADVLDEITAMMPPDSATTSDEPDDGILARIMRGAKKVGGFLNPFD